MKKNKIFIADDHRLFLDGLESILSSVDEFEIVGHAYSGKEALSAIKELKPTIAILDISMPDINGIEITKIVKKNFPDIKILLFVHKPSCVVSKLLERLWLRHKPVPVRCKWGRFFVLQWRRNDKRHWLLNHLRPWP